MSASDSDDTADGLESPPQEEEEQEEHRHHGRRPEVATVDEKGHLSKSGKPLISLDEMADRLGFGCFHVGLLFVVSAIWLADAMEMMLISFVSPPLQCYFDLSDAEKALISSVVFVGMFFGAAAWGWFQDRAGRKIGYFTSVAWVLLFGVGTAAADNFYLVLFCRFMVGFGVAGSHVAVTIFTEFLPPSKRALFIVLISLFWSFGSILEAGLAWMILPALPMETGWRWLIGVSAFPLLVTMFMWPVLPESPRFNLVKGRPERIEPVFRRAFKINGVPYPEEFEIDTALAAGDFDDHSAHAGSCKDLFKTEVMRRTTLMLWGIWLVCAFMYYGVIMFTTELFLEEDSGLRCPQYLNGSSEGGGGGGDFGFTTAASAATTGMPNGTTLNATGPICVQLKDADYRDAFVQSVAELPAMIWTFLLLEKWGRKPAMGLQMILSGAFFLVLAVCTSRGTETFFLFLVRGLVMGAFQSAFVYTPEVYPTNIRATGIGMASSAARIGGLATPYAAQVLMVVTFEGTVAVYAALAVVAGVLSFLLPLETRGVSLTDSVDEVPVVPPAAGEPGGASGGVGGPKPHSSKSKQYQVVDSGGQAGSAAGAGKYQYGSNRGISLSEMKRRRNGEEPPAAEVAGAGSGDDESI